MLHSSANVSYISETNVCWTKYNKETIVFIFLWTFIKVILCYPLVDKRNKSVRIILLYNMTIKKQKHYFKLVRNEHVVTDSCQHSIKTRTPLLLDSMHVYTFASSILMIIRLSDVFTKRYSQTYLMQWRIH